MKKALCVTGKVFGTVFKVFAVGSLFIGHFIMNIIGVLLCAITEG